MIKTGRLGPLPGFLVSPTRERSNNRLVPLAPALRADFYARIISIQARHPDIKQYQFRVKVASDLHRFSSIVSGPNLVTHDLQHYCKAARNILVVVSD